MEISKYLETLATEAGFLATQSGSIKRVAHVLTDRRNMGNRIFICGNGGSAATADHFTLDLQKAANVPCISLSSTAAITAYANDLSYSDIYAEQIRRLSRPRDVLIAISTSGNSQNVIKAAQYAKGTYMFCITLTGFRGGDLRGLGDIPIHIDSNIIEIVEDLHTATLHSIVRYIKGLHRGQP